MNSGIRYTIGGLAFALVLGATYILNFGLYPRFFDIAWDEEVQLHDGRVIVVHVKNTYERQRRGFQPYDESKIILLHKALTFEPEPGRTHTFKTRMPVAYLGQFDKKWYAVISGQGPYGNYPEEMPTHWGNDFTTLEQRLAILDGDTFRPISWDLAPPQLTQMNLMRSAFWNEFVSWDDKRLSHIQKKAFNEAHPTPYRQEITRPLRLQKVQGDKK